MVAPHRDATIAVVFDPGTEIVVREVWDGLLWAARPARVISDDGETLVHWTPAGAIGCFATSRYFPGREQLPRDERQLVSLESRRWHYRGAPARGTSLVFVRDGAWSSVAPTWQADGRFVHWYVNFQRPASRRVGGYDTLDLVLDIVVAPDRTWTWKDRGAFDLALARGIFDASVAEAVEVEAERVQRDIAAGAGPFEERWTTWAPPIEWTTPVLPDGFADGVATPPGSVITLDPEPVITE
jgi:predicted RNA-binding protein associated with RNAse of E/G family